MDKYSVLLIEDEEFSIFMMQEMLELIGCKVDSANTVQKAVDYSKKHLYDYYLVDIIMNEESGLDALKEMNISEVSKRVIILSANINSLNLDQARSIGVTKFLPKPIKIDDLKKMIF